MIDAAPLRAPSSGWRQIPGRVSGPIAGALPLFSMLAGYGATRGVATAAAIVLAPGVALAAVIAPQFLIGGYVHSGVWITAPAIERIGSAKASSALAIALVLAGIIVALRRGVRWSPAEQRVYGLCGAFGIYVLAWSLFGGAGTSFAVRTVSILVIPSCLSFLIQDARDLEYAIAGSLIVGTALGLYAVAHVGVTGELHAFSENRIVFGRSMGVMAVVLGTRLIVNRGKRIAPISLAATAAAGLATFLSGSRGAVVAAAAAVILVALFARGTRGLTRRTGTLTASLASVIILVGLLAGGSQQLKRLTGLAHPASDATSASRMVAATLAIHSWEQSPVFGVGPGNFHYLVRVGPKAQELDYPHNLILEVLSEEGIVGLVLVVSALAITGAAVFKRRVALSPAAWCAVSAFLFYAISAQFSGDFEVNRQMWTFAALSLAALRFDGIIPTTA